MSNFKQVQELLFPTPWGVGMDTNMKATLLLQERQIIPEDQFVEVVIWRVPAQVPGSAHDYKYRLAFVVDDVCVIRFDNEAGKGDHKHIGVTEIPYCFVAPAQLVADFWAAVDEWRLA